ncbi:Or9e81 [Eciton burchellii]|nr:Or9e81 [Eciton burchellii]
MVSFEDPHFNLNRILLLAIGLWPYEQSKFARFQYIFFSVILMEAIIFQLIVFVSSTFTSDLLIKVLSSACFFTIIEIKYVLFSIDMNIIKELLMQFQYIRNELKDKNEIAIAETYSYNARRYTAALTIIGMCIIFILIIAQFWTEIFDIVLQMNVSRSRTMPIMTEYFVDQEKYFYFIVLWINITICVQVIVLLAIGTMFITFFQHIYGMFKIASYRIEHSLDMDILKSNMKVINLVCERIICAIDIQRQAMNLSIFLVKKLEIMMSCIIIFAVTILSLNRIFQIMSFEKNFAEIVLHFFFAIGIILYMFIANYLGQELTDHNKEIFLVAYNIKWYITPIRIQKMILFLLQRNVRDFTVSIGRLFVPSLQGFATLVKTSASYFTVIHSIR